MHILSCNCHVWAACGCTQAKKFVLQKNPRIKRTKIVFKRTVTCNLFMKGKSTQVAVQESSMNVKKLEAATVHE